MPVCDTVSGVLIVSPNGELRRELKSRVKSERWRLMEAVSGAHALGQLESEDFQLLLLDPSLPDLNSNEFQKLVRSQFPHLQILPLDRQTGLPLPSSPREKLGDELAGLLGTEVVVSRAPEMIGHEPLNQTVSPLPGMIGGSASMQRVYHMTQLVARRDTTVLVLGQSGTGKDLVAQAIHNLSPRRGNPFVVINCAAIPEALLEAELFGYTKGAFTGAVQSRIGRAKYKGWAARTASKWTSGLWRQPMEAFANWFRKSNSARISFIAWQFFPSSYRSSRTAWKICRPWQQVFSTDSAHTACR